MWGINMSNLTPSSAARRIACPGSRLLEQQFPKRNQEISKHIEEGIKAHKIAMRVLTGAPIVESEYFLNTEMYDHALFFKKTVQEKINGSINPDYIETTLDLSMIHQGMTGRPDYFHIDIDNGTVYIFEYKYGFKNVETYENWQLIEYAYGIFQHIEPPCFNVVFVVVQPRISNSVKEWRISLLELYTYFQTMTQKEKQSLEPNAPCIPNPECMYCSARFNCAALQAFSLPLIDYARSNIVNNLTPEALSNELQFLREARDLLDARITGLEEEATYLIKSGKRVPSFILQESRGSLNWSRSVEEIIALGELLEIDLKKPQEVITPKQAIKAGLDDKLISLYAQYKPGNLKLVLQKDIARKVFNVIDETVNNK